MLRPFLSRVLQERDAVLRALSADSSNSELQQQLSAWRTPSVESLTDDDDEAGGGWQPQGKTTALLDELRPRAEESGLDRAYAAAVQAIVQSPGAARP